MAKQKILRIETTVDGTDGPFTFTAIMPEGCSILGGELHACFGFMRVIVDVVALVDAPVVSRKLIVMGKGDEADHVTGNFECQLRARGVDGDEEIAYLFELYEDENSNA